MLLNGTIGNDTLTGSNENDTLSGLKGNDYLEGKGGSDTYLFQLGDGQDTIYDPSSIADTSIDQLVFSGTGLTAANAIVTRANENDDLKISFKGLSDSVTLAFQATKYAQPLDGIDRVTFSDGVVWNKEQLLAAYLATGASTNDTIYGTGANNTLRGGQGRDYLEGRGGSDTYLFQLGDGQDTIYDPSSIADTSSDRLVFSGAGLTAANAVITRVFFAKFDSTYFNLKISFKGLSDSVLLLDTVRDDGAVANYGRDGIETVTFSDGTVWTKSQLWNKSTVQPNLALTGTSSNDTLTGSAGDDQLLGLDGNDTLKGGRGDDSLNGGLGADTYLFQLGDGGDTIRDTGYDSAIDRLIFSGSGLTSTNAIVTRFLGTSNDLQIAFRGLTDSVVLKDQLSGGFASTYGVERVQFSNGVTWTEAQLWNAYLTQGASSDDRLFGTDAADRLKGGLGNDFLNGGLGADTMPV